MSLEVTKYKQTWIDGLNRGDVSPADEPFTPNCIIHMAGAPEPSLSITAFKELGAGLLSAFADFHITVEEQIVSGDKVATRWLTEVRHNGPLGEAQHTGRKVQFEGLIFDHIIGAQAAERWEQWDQMGMMQQLNLV